MKYVIIKEFGQEMIPDLLEKAEFTLDLTKRNIKDCAGCWVCWQKTPGRCLRGVS